MVDIQLIYIEKCFNNLKVFKHLLILVYSLKENIKNLFKKNYFSLYANAFVLAI